MLKNLSQKCERKAILTWYFANTYITIFNKVAAILILKELKIVSANQRAWYIYTYTKLYLNHASLNSRWKAGFHEGREITYLQEINYLQEIQNITKNIQVILAAQLHTRKFQLILCFNNDLKELKDSVIFASWGRLFQCKAPL
jgi:hypothetical protein